MRTDSDANIELVRAKIAAMKALDLDGAAADLRDKFIKAAEMTLLCCTIVADSPHVIEGQS